MDNMIEASQLRTVDSFVSGVDLLRSLDVFTDEQALELTGFGLLPGSHKERLIGVPFLILEFEFKTGHDNSSYVECAIVTTKDEKLMLRDSSKGIYAQLRSVHDERIKTSNAYPTLGYYARKGLSFQEFPYVTPTGEHVKPRTYYLA